MADTMMYHHVHQHSTPSSHPNAVGNHTSSLAKSASVRSKRKSAVELLAESKPLYVKSESVRDREQALPQRCGGTALVGGQGFGTYMRSKSIGATAGYVSGRQVSTMMMTIPQQYMAVVSPSRSLPPLSHHISHTAHRRTINHPSTAPPAATSASLGYHPPPPLGGSVGAGNSDLLQNRLRQLLVNCTPTTALLAPSDNGGGGGSSSNGATGAGSVEDVLLSVEQLGPLSPPAEYATATSPGAHDRGGGGGQRCHKSLPDLHCRGEPSSNKSSNKSLSNRDSGGSSGHYTQHSEPPPPPRQEVRRDSGSSTQHSNASSYYCCQEAECRAAARAQQQAYAAAAAHAAYQQQLVMQQPQPQYVGQMQYGAAALLAAQMSGPVQQQPTVSLGVGVGVGVNSLQPPVTFKRQKCLRYKRDRPILRSKSDISDRYWRPPDPPVSHLEQFFEHLGLTSDRYEDMFSLSGRSSASPVFFSDVSTVDSSAPPDAPVGGAATTAAAAAYPPNHPPSSCAVAAAAAFRPNEPPSIVERNARIIKWLCHCRKAQML